MPVIALQDRLAYAPTTSSTPSSAPALASVHWPLKPQDLADYEQLTAEGKLVETSQKLEDLKRKLEQLNAAHR